MIQSFATHIFQTSQKPIKKDFADYDTILSFGYFWHTLPADKQLFVLHPLFINESKAIKSLRYEVGTEFGVMWLLAHTLLHLLEGEDSKTNELQTSLEQVDMGYLSSETNLAEEELEFITQHTQVSKKTLALVLGTELAFHPNARDIALICGILGKSRHIDIIMPEILDSHIDFKNTSNSTDSKAQNTLQICEDLPESNGNFIYVLPYSNSAVSKDSINTLTLPPLFAPALKLKSKQHITLSFESNRIDAVCECDNTKKGTIAMLYTSTLNNIGYPYKKVEVIL
ncbi:MULTISPECIES: hypothetical protein [Helicobacter]|uniref:hypothetical protein n=1 Tax=Helicobacter TaxID=209 RepID=UPI00068B747C|nr:hypothetical protein [Helicobacter sp. MIT 03-1616]